MYIYVFMDSVVLKKHIFLYMLCAIYTKTKLLYSLRGVAQFGSVPAWGAGGRRFKSSRPDQIYQCA
jgi:hypothetical protein